MYEDITSVSFSSLNDCSLKRPTITVAWGEANDCFNLSRCQRMFKSSETLTSPLGKWARCSFFVVVVKEKELPYNGETNGGKCA